MDFLNGAEIVGHELAVDGQGMQELQTPDLGGHQFGLGGL